MHLTRRKWHVDARAITVKMKSGGLKLVPKDKKKGFIDKAKEFIMTKLQSGFAAAATTTTTTTATNEKEKGRIDFTKLTHRIPPEVIEQLRAITSYADITSSDKFQVEGGDLSGSGGVCRRIIYQNQYLFVVKTIEMQHFRDRDYLRLEREIDIHNSLCHQRIPPLFHTFVDHNIMYLVMQYAGECLFEEFIEEKQDIVNVCEQLELFLTYSHLL